METKHPAYIEKILDSTEPASLEQILEVKKYISGNYEVIKDPRFARWVRTNKDTVRANEETILKRK